MSTLVSRRTVLAGGLRAAPVAMFPQVFSLLFGAAQKAGYNVLFFAVDDLRPDLGCYGNRNIRSPHIDALAERGTVFTRAYCQQAVCSPSRTSLLTGLRPDTTRVYELQTHFRKHLPEVITLPERFRHQGYATTGFSKIYHGGLDDARSWSIAHWDVNGPAWGTPENEARAKRNTEQLQAAGWYRPSVQRPRSERGPSWAAPDVADDDLADGKTASAAIGALGKLRNQPFFLAVGFLKPHLPFIAPKKYFDLYPKEKVSLVDYPLPPEDVPQVALHNSGELRNYNDIPERGPVSQEKALELIRAYHAASSYTDAQVGRVVAELDRLGLRKNTVIILWGDHGYHLGNHGLWNKHTNFEKAVRVPLIISAPGQRKPGAKTAGLTEFVDIYPSLCELCGVKAPEGLEGSSFVPLMEQPDRSWKKAAFSQYPRNVASVGGVMGHSVRTDRYRYTEWTAPGKDYREVELYDYETDPNESRNLAKDAGKAKLVAELAGLLRAGWRAALPPGA